MSRTRPYQAQLKADIYEAWKSFNVVGGVLPTGGGKTWIFTEIIKEMAVPTVAIAHRQEIVAQICLSLAKHGVRHKLIAPDNVIKLVNRLEVEEIGRSFYHPSASVAVAGVDTLISRQNRLGPWVNSIKLWVMDECFPAGTLVGGTPIENLCVGDYVTSFDDKTERFSKKKITHLFKNPLPNYMVRVTVGHHVINTTSNHPFYTKKGWVEAKNLTEQDEVLQYEMHPLRKSGFKPKRAPTLPFKKIWKNILLQKMWVGLSNSKFKAEKTVRAAHIKLYSLWKRTPKNSPPLDYTAVYERKTCILWEKMFGGIPSKNFLGNNGENQPKVCVGPNEEKQSYAQRSRTGKGIEYTQSGGALSEDSGRERHGAYSGRSVALPDIWAARFRSSTLDTDGRPWGWVPERVQAGYRALGAKIGYRSGRGESFVAKRTRTRPKKRGVSKWVRVDGVKVFESRNLRGDRKGDAGNYVYNIEVEDFHTYVAEGIVVHNCHHILQENKWGKAAALFPNARGLGVTATPIRADGKGLGPHADGLIDTLVLGPSMRDLINNRYLADYRIFAPPSDLNYSEMVTGSNGDWTGPSVKKAVRKSRVIGDVVTHYLRIAPGKLGITFAPDVETATDIAKQFNEAGVPAAVCTAKTPELERVKLLRDFRARKILQLVNVALFGEGFDVPGVEVVSLASPTLSYSKFAQECGRCLRFVDGKIAIIIDHVGNVARHARVIFENGRSVIDLYRDNWTLDRRERTSRGTPDDVIPVRACPECTAVYERIYKACPYCGFEPIPAARSGPEWVDGDLTELDADALARMRGEAVPVDMPVSEYLRLSGAAHLPPAAARGAAARFKEKQVAQSELRLAIALWAGQQRAIGRPDSESYRLFYHTFKIDVLSAQALKRAEAEELTRRINANL